MGDMADSIEHMECWIGADLDEDDMETEMPETASDEPVTRLIERLTAPSNWLRQGAGSWKNVVSEYDRAPFEAASRLAALQQRVDELERRHGFVPHPKYPWFCDKCGYAPHDLLQHSEAPKPNDGAAQYPSIETLAQRYPEVLAAHAQFGGDLKDMLRRYEDNSALRAAQRQIDRNGS